MFLIAEVGVNHNGDLAEARKYVSAAKHAGADAVKFQFFNSRKLWGDDRIRHLELRFDDFVVLHRDCEKIGIEFMCTAFGVEELTLLRPLLKRVKIASGCINRVPLLEAARDTGLPIILSTGMSAIEDIAKALYCIESATLMHCTSAYPCRLEDANLRAIETLRREFPGCDIGYSDHTGGITVALAAAALGATVIEKHVTFDRNAKGPDHKASITPREFKAMQLGCIDIGYALGDGVKRVLPCEEKLRSAWGR